MQACTTYITGTVLAIFAIEKERKIETRQRERERDF